MVEVYKKDHESQISLIRRFSKKVQQSGKLLTARKKRYLEKPKNKRLMKLGAMRREKIKVEKELLTKLGKLEEKYPKFGRPRR